MSTQAVVEVVDIDGGGPIPSSAEVLLRIGVSPIHAECERSEEIHPYLEALWRSRLMAYGGYADDAFEASLVVSIKAHAVSCEREQAGRAIARVIAESEIMH